jgi:hypothetical protein
MRAKKTRPVNPSPRALPGPGAAWDVNLFFSSDSSEGWSEHYIVTASDPITASDVIAGLVPLRAACLTNKFQIDNARLSDFAIHGDSYPVVGPIFPVVGTYTTTSEDPNVANVALKVRLLCDPPFRGLIYFRGLDESITSGRSYSAPPAFDSAFNAYKLYLEDPTNQFQVNLESPPGSGVMAFHGILTVAIYGVTCRKPGRPFGLPVGRRPRPVVVSTSAAKQLTGSGAATVPKRV